MWHWNNLPHLFLCKNFELIKTYLLEVWDLVGLWKLDCVVLDSIKEGSENQLLFEDFENPEVDEKLPEKFILKMIERIQLLWSIILKCSFDSKSMYIQIENTTFLTWKVSQGWNVSLAARIWALFIWWNFKNGSKAKKIVSERFSIIVQIVQLQPYWGFPDWGSLDFIIWGWEMNLNILMRN